MRIDHLKEYEPHQPGYPAFSGEPTSQEFLKQSGHWIPLFVGHTATQYGNPPTVMMAEGVRFRIETGGAFRRLALGSTGPPGTTPGPTQLPEADLMRHVPEPVLSDDIF